MSLAHGGGAIFTSGRLLCTHAYVVTTRVDPRESHSISWLLAQDVQDVDKLKEFLFSNPNKSMYYFLLVTFNLIPIFKRDPI